MIERFFIFDGGESKMVLDEKIEEKLDQILKDKFKCSEEKMKTIKKRMELDFFQIKLVFLL